MTTDYRRATQLERIESDDSPWDVAVIGGGATGLGVAVDAASRGYRTVLFERHDFGKGTSSRSTKLVHGGVRYLQQGRVKLVLEALRERGRLRHNAPHLVHPLLNVVPLYAWWERPYYGLGLRVYDWLSGRWSLGPSRHLSASETIEKLPTIEQNGLRGGISYFDGAFDDTRLLANLMQTAIDLGGVCLNYTPVRELTRQAGRVNGLVAEDTESGRSLRIVARVVINATGPFSDQVRRLDEPSASAMIAPSQGIHLVFGREFLPGDAALLVPRTRDGRVVFAVPWLEHVMVGTTDTPLDDTPSEPQARRDEIDFLLETLAPYLAKKPGRADIRSVFAGIRPLVRSGGGGSTARLSRDFVLRASSTSLVSIMGGKWTTYRKMAEDCVDLVARVGQLPPQQCKTEAMVIHGGENRLGDGGRSAEGQHIRPFIYSPMLFDSYGSDGPDVEKLVAENTDWQQRLDDRLPYLVGQVVWAARREMARTVEDVLARRTRALFLDAEAALASAPRVAELLAAELGRDSAWQADQLKQFQEVAQHYRP